MARITVDDCLDKVGDDNRFALVHLAVARVKQHRNGAPMLVSSRKNKEIVMTLREIAAGKVSFLNIKELSAKVAGRTAATEAPVVSDAEPVIEKIL